MDLCLIFLIILAIILCVIAYIQIVSYGKVEHFNSDIITENDTNDNNKLLIKKHLTIIRFLKTNITLPGY